MAEEVGGAAQIAPEGVRDSTCLQGLGNEGGACPQELGPYLNELKTKQNKHRNYNQIMGTFKPFP